MTNFFYRPLKFLLYCEFMDMRMLNILINDKSTNQMFQFAYYFTNTAASFALFSHEFFSESICKKSQLKLVNEFDKKSNKWVKKLVIPNKYTNFHRCLMTMNVFETYELTYFDYDGNANGPGVDLFKAMSGKGNFITNIQKLNASFEYGDPKSTPADSNRYIVPNVRFRLFSATSLDVHINGHSTTSFYEEIIGFLITPSEPYTSYEKLILPFDETTWFYILIVFICAFFAIPIINLVSQKFQNVFYGEGVMTPAFNIIGTFFGIGQIKLPDDDFPRILLMTFILFCLLIRTAYQSVLFEYVATDLRKPLPRTIDDLLDWNYTIYASWNAYFRLFDYVPQDKR